MQSSLLELSSEVSASLKWLRSISTHPSRPHFEIRKCNSLSIRNRKLELVVIFFQMYVPVPLGSRPFGGFGDKEIGEGPGGGFGASAVRKHGMQFDRSHIPVG